jgi:hypothetical protein
MVYRFKNNKYQYEPITSGITPGLCVSAGKNELHIRIGVGLPLAQTEKIHQKKPSCLPIQSLMKGLPGS